MSPVPAVSDEEEVRRALKMLEALIKAHGSTKKALDQKLGKGPGYISQVLTGRLELKYRHILEILGALDLDPGLFFRALFLEPERPSESGRMMERFLEGLQKMGYYGEKLPPAPLPLIDAAELDRRIRAAIEDALAERRDGTPSDGNFAAGGGGGAQTAGRLSNPSGRALAKG
jgi:transcriptional regulator with XRE-family HTH domain